MKKEQKAQEIRNLTEELSSFRNAEQFALTNYFEEPFFETKKVVYLPLHQ